MKKILFVMISAVVVYAIANARPQYSMLTGNRCLACHVHEKGGGARDMLGAYTKSSVSLIPIKGTATGDFFNDLAKYNSFMNGKALVGLDFRFQSAKLGGPVNNERKYFSMQFSPYLTYTPVKWLHFTGHYNFIDMLYDNLSIYEDFQIYQGQQTWSASVQIKPDPRYPSLRAGFFMPSVGNKFDDHTLMIRQITTQIFARPFIPPDYAELGAEISYDGLKWLNLTAGVFNSESMAEINYGGTQLSREGKATPLLRAAFLPRFFNNQLNTNIGGSYFFNEDFYIANAFVHLGWTDKISLITEYMHYDQDDLLSVDNFLVELLYQIDPALTLSGRIEDASTEDLISGDVPMEYNSMQYVVGANIYFLPFMEFRPEYRIFDRDEAESYSSQWTFQLHLYY